jgi:ceramide glucosyltransferase
MAKAQLLNPAPSWQPARSRYTALWHGCLEDDRGLIEKNGIDLTKGDPRADFGLGFYVTTFEVQAIWMLGYDIDTVGWPNTGEIDICEHIGREPATIHATIHGPNYKVCNLINAYPRAKHKIIIVCDSDIRVGEGYLREVCAPFADPEVGLVTSLYRSPGVRGAATAVEAMGFTSEMVPNVMVALKLEGLSFALGASMAVRREALEKIGGFPILADYLADDYQLGNKVFRAGYRIELSDCFVESIMHREGFGTVLSRQLRWARTMRASRPGGYFASGITQPFPAACLALALSGCSAAGVAALLLLYLVRALTAMIYSRSFVKDGIFPRWLWLLPLRDALAFAIWALAFLGNRVRWRGHLFRLLPGGRIVELPEQA